MKFAVICGCGEPAETRRCDAFLTIAVVELAAFASLVVRGVVLFRRNRFGIWAKDRD
jgi:hypothetical protein